MTNMLKMMKQLKDVKKMQKQLARKTVEVSSPDGMMTVVAQGDMKLRSVRIDPRAMDPSNPEALARLIVSTVNSALDSSKKAVADDMSKLTEGMGLGNLLG